MTLIAQSLSPDRPPSGYINLAEPNPGTSRRTRERTYGLSPVRPIAGFDIAPADMEFLHIGAHLPGTPLLNELLALRRVDTRHFDPEVWAFTDQIDLSKSGVSRLVNVDDAALQKRLDSIETNIQYLDTGQPVSAGHTAFSGWKSPWWWWRARHLTLLEFERRGLTPVPAPVIPPPIVLAPALRGVNTGGGELLVRLSQKRYLMQMLQAGQLRFAPAASYDDSRLDAARADDEMAKAYQRPGQVLRITTEDGRAIEAIGDVSFARQRRSEDAGALVDHPYWMMSFSSDLDPRLLDAFASADPDEDAFLVVFDVRAFFERAAPVLADAAPGGTYSLVQNDYFDPYYPPGDGLQAIRSKLMAYAYQREVRFAVDPLGYLKTAADGCLYVEIGSIEDIAGVYGRDGSKIAGIGPATWSD